tara:strand:- start:7337 stop:7441 length:105 start_codon:yes stop_codon:yes gene_type:complete
MDAMVAAILRGLKYDIYLLNAAPADSQPAAWMLQ